ncbi:MAG: DNA polymerase III subunit chi [Sphingobium sp.]|nr:DNA polymerase III subunit chi [Sphingobium sp.]MBP6111200.1 DNA polymerase III subunit chi [Sphingobium sp.]MBP8670236.1 DNA polymerase III subunit chi [Sphingobium sp.]MBP9156174.1 DNA polymerase III subunit chi [Sphingobium sp.]
MRVDFYQLSHDQAEQVLPAIAQKLMDEGGRLLVVDGREGSLSRISRALWEARPDSFLAHGLAGDGDEAMQPILLCADAPDTPANAASSIALTDGVWRDAALGFERAFYFFDAATIAAARDCWRALKGRDAVTPRFWRQEGRKWIEGP